MFNSISAEQKAVDENARGAAARAAANAAGAARAANAGSTNVPASPASFFGSLFRSAPSAPMPASMPRARAASPPPRGVGGHRKSRRRRLTRRLR